MRVVSGFSFVALLAATAPVQPGQISASTQSADAERPIQFVFTSDAHYGLTRRAFRGHTHVDASTVNRALVAGINALPNLSFPDDGGVRGGSTVGSLDFLVEGGDVANREEVEDGVAIQAAAESWAQFERDYLQGVKTVNADGAPTTVFVVPGNHDASDAVGFYKPMTPTNDPRALIAIENLMRQPGAPLTVRTFDCNRDRLFAGTTVRGVRFQFLHIWPDSNMRARMAADIDDDPRTPVIVFTHDQPDVEAKHFINPNGAHDVNRHDQFENLLADVFADGSSISQNSTHEQMQLESFLTRHPQITGYFHGNSNWHHGYEWNGPHRTARIHVFRADSPMKGAVSAYDERRLSFEVVSIDPGRQIMTVRECLWKAEGAGTVAPVWGDSMTVTIAPPNQ